MDNQNKSTRRKINMKLKRVLLMLLVTVLSVSGIVTANAVTVKDDGKYTLILTCGLNGMDGKVDGKLIRIDCGRSSVQRQHQIRLLGNGLDGRNKSRRGYTFVGFQFGGYILGKRR